MKRITLALLAVLLAVPAALAEVTLPSVFGDHMVLQRDTEVRIWGKAEPGEQITVNLARTDGVKAGEQRTATAGGDGAWSLKLSAHASEGVWELQFSGTKTAKPILIKDVVFGEVWVASGQSNMSWIVAQSDNAKEEIANSANDQVRMWTAQRTVKPEPAFDVAGSWAVASPQATGDFSAVAYFFARQLQKELGVPVGILHSSWGGTPVEAWTSRDKLAKMDVAGPILERFATAMQTYDKRLAEYKQGVAFWEKTRNGPENTGLGKGFAKPGFDDSQWKTMALPTNWENAGLEDKDGVVWFRRTIDLPDGWAGQKLRLELGPIDDGDTTYVNGKQVGQTVPYNPGAWQRPRSYEVPADLVKAGKLSIAVRVVDLSGGGGLYGKADQLRLSRADGQGQPVPLAGDWRYFFAHEINNDNRPVRPPPPPFGPDHPHSPAGLFNGMINPIVPYTIKGAIWYQGESNASRAKQYGQLFPGMIEDWRQRWGQGDFPFLFVQLANWRAPEDKPTDPDWAHLRDAQLHTLRRTMNTGMAVTIDIGAANDIHPRNKQDVGKRLARWALADTYGKDVVKSGPLYQNHSPGQVEGNNALVVGLVNFGSGLEVKGDGPLEGFTIAGKDGKFVNANARIIEAKGDKLSRVIVWSDQVKEPFAVRYAWENNPDEANLINEEGLPASPFRTDDFSGPTDDRQ